MKNKIIRLGLLITYICPIIMTCNLWAHVILIDPGHGGSDTGAQRWINKKLYSEKDLALQFSQRLYDELRKEKANTVFMTRSFDRLVGLHERTQMAEKVKADIFVSIHINSSLDIGSKGFEVYYLNNHKDFGVRKVEEAENKSFDAKGFKSEDPMVNKILLDVIIEKTVQQSQNLANCIHNSVEYTFPRGKELADRGVKPGLLYVLALAQRPSSLVEIGFLSNPDELQRMLSADFQIKMAQALARGIKDYLASAKK